MKRPPLPPGASLWAPLQGAAEQVSPKPLPHPKDPLHGVTLEQMLLHLVEHLGWGELGRVIPIQCFRVNPSIKSSLTFLRRTPWARKQVETLYLRTIQA